MKMVLTMLFRILNAFFQNVLGLLHKLAVQVNLVLIDPARRVVLPEDILGRLTVEVVHLGVVRFALVGQLLRPGSITGLVGLLGLHTSQGILAAASRQGSHEEDESSNYEVLGGKFVACTYAIKAGIALLGFGSGKVSEAVVLAFDIVVVTVPEG